ncbi:hypothetical protein K1W54_17945, partial [Micromonospora sp. CPCC 205371]|nr:hypothetical protein [Micromonospora sp. CPCC 205371]
VVARALATNPGGRYPGAAAFAVAIRAAQDATAVVASPPPAGPGGPGAAPALAEPTRAAQPATAVVASPPPASTGAPEAATAAVPPVPIDPFAQLRAGPAAEQPTEVRPAAGGNRRRNLTLAGVGATVLALIAVLAVAAFGGGSEAPQASTPSPVETSAPSAGSGVAERVGPATDGPVQPVRPSPSRTTPAPAQASASPERPSSPTPRPSPSGGSTTNPYTPAQVCGSGYKVIDSAALGASGKVYLLYNAGNGNNCVVTLKTTSVGTATTVSAYLQAKDESRVTDKGSFEFYAGPVRVKAPGVCIAWGGTAGGVTYNSPFEHCG